MKSSVTLLSTIAMSFILASCASLNNLPTTAEEQKTLTPDAVLQDLMAGNARYVNGRLTSPNVKMRIAAS